jgi:hypothetical protein
MAIEFPGLTINESDYKTKKGKGRIAVFLYGGKKDPRQVLDNAIYQYVGNNGYHELVDSNMDNPWMRVILSDINNIEQKQFDGDIHKIDKKIDEAQ